MLPFFHNCEGLCFFNFPIWVELKMLAYDQGVLESMKYGILFNEDGNCETCN